ncbi:uncharacterized protein LOC108597779 isoform X2 [Drosophila busckii]|uniref:uncharacterized protein LOC108597779 isoform X2 n=1 Tax=Drosophila busckii TaxID=30019 RepID=UPI00083EA977|nr:uncharacterized protein LOC108597779 isoform X2 [Drosophila busckii]
MPASSGLYHIKRGRVLDSAQKSTTLIFIAFMAACSTCGNNMTAATPAAAPATATAAITMAPHSGAAGRPSEELPQRINQNLIMSPRLADASTAALTASASGGGSSITSFDSNRLHDEKQQQQQQPPTHLQQQLEQLQQHQHSRIQAKDTAGPYPLSPQRPEPVENHLEATNGNGNGIDGADNVFGTPMYFGTENSTLVTTQIGATAHVPCTVHHIGEGVVSWIRKKDYHLLTVGLTTYSSDERFSATHLKHSEDWTLQIKFVQLRDAGVYECQVSTHPPTSIFLHLSVVARAEISGPPIRYLTPGSLLRLQCRVVQNTEASEYIFWYHDNRMINYDIDRGINVSTEPDFQSSELTIQRTRREHSGNFTCVASNTQPASVLVHIFKGDNPAAMYHGHVGGSTKTTQCHLHNLMAIIAIGYRIFHTSVYMKIV